MPLRSTYLHICTARNGVCVPEALHHLYLQAFPLWIFVISPSLTLPSFVRYYIANSADFNRSSKYFQYLGNLFIWAVIQVAYPAAQCLCNRL